MEPPALMDELKSATTMPGALSVMTCGLLMMQMWHVGNLDSVALVTKYLCEHAIKINDNPSLQVPLL